MSLGDIMNSFRLYRLDVAGNVLGPPDVFSCESDEAAIEKTKRLVNDGHDGELWQLERLVFRLRSPGQ
ncbi:MAG: hypothetical protein JWR77_2667 [Rhizorhabdus sp.]|nr:hypothetical protein [Rhizorhabdus sp.]